MSLHRRVLGTALVLSSLFLLPASRPALGQAVFGNIVGTVTDASGAAVPNAEVTITDIERGITYQTRSNADGNYTQTHLLAGHYSVRVTAAGFAEFEARADVQIDATTRVDAQVQVGKSQAQVTVSAETPLLMVDRAEVSNTLTASEVEKLPILNRNVTTLVLAMPGAQLNGFQHASSENPQGGLQINVNGQYFYSNGFELDGTENHSNILGIAVVNPNPDALQEFKVTTSNYDAEFGNVSGALLQGTTKSGTNQVHGSAFEYLRNDVFNAENPFTHLNPPIRWNQFGGTIGGPLKKDRVFGFFDYQGTRRRTGGSLITTTPTADERNGNLTALLGNYICADGTTSSTPCSGGHQPYMVKTTEGLSVPAQAGLVFDPNTGDPLTGAGRQAISTGGQVNVITPAAPMTKLLTYLPPPNFGPAGAVANNYVASIKETFDSDAYDGRLDYNISDREHFFGRYSIADFTKQSPGAYGDLAGGPSAFGFAGHSDVRNQSLALGWTYSLNPTLITDFRFGTYRYRVHVLPNGTSTPASDAGIPGLNRGTPDTVGMPAFYVNGNGGFNFGYALGVNQCNCPLSETENHFQWVNNWTKQTGNHTIKWGADVRRAQQKRIDSSTHRSGETTFKDSTTGSPDVDTIANGNATTGAALASYLLGVPNNFVQQFSGIGFYPSLRQTRLYFFGQDSWRATPKLTVSLGLRYENYLPQTGTKPGSAATFDPLTGEVVVAGIGTEPRNMGIQAYNWGFAPRVGLAYELQPTTVLRAGYGRGFNGAGVGAVFGQNPELDPPVQFVANQTAGNAYVTAIPNFVTNGPPNPANPPIGPKGRYPLPDGISVFFYFDQPNAYRIPLADFWNFSVQHQFRPDLSLEVAYVGNVGRHLFANENRNQAVPGNPIDNFDVRRPFANFGLTQAIYDVCNCDNSSYNGLQVKLEKRVSHGLDFLMTYTWSKAITQSEGGYNFANNYDLHGDHGPASWDHTHALTLLHNWDLPFGKGKRWASNSSKIVDAAIGGWRFSGFTTLLSGQAFTPLVSNAPLVYADFNMFRPDVIGNPHVSNPNRDVWFNPNAYTAPQQEFRDGTASKGSLRGPAQYVFNLSLAKDFVIAEGKTLEFRWENFNAPNHTNLALPGNTVDVTGAGQITATSTDMREMQFALHFRF
jgi:hypothetical protein